MKCFSNILVYMCTYISLFVCVGNFINYNLHFKQKYVTNAITAEKREICMKIHVVNNY